PKDKLRVFYAFAYSSLAFNFLLMHEIGHIVRGHNGYVSSKIKEYKWEEIDYRSIRGPYITPINSQTMEMDADSFATNHAFIQAHYYITHPNAWDEAKSDSRMNLIYKDYPSFCGHWCFAVYTLFRLFGFQEIKPDRIRSLSHPPAVIRMSMILANV